jgi:hypothetical protein
VNERVSSPAGGAGDCETDEADEAEEADRAIGGARWEVDDDDEATG